MERILFAMTHVALLRAINVGGTGIVRMTELQKAFSGAGCRNVRTVIASGNVLFEADDLDAVRPGILKKVAAVMSGDPVIMFRTLRELETLVRAAPFGALVEDRVVKLYVMFMAAKPARTPVFPLVQPKERLEAIGMRKRDVFIVSRRKPNGWYGFPGTWLERELGVAATARSWSTVTKLVALEKTKQ